MPPIEARVKDLLDEPRPVMPGAQTLLGLQYRAAFSSGFRRLPVSFQTLDCVALRLILERNKLLNWRAAGFMPIGSATAGAN